MKSIKLTSFFMCGILFVGDYMEIIKFPDQGYYERLSKIVIEQGILKKNGR